MGIAPLNLFCHPSKIVFSAAIAIICVTFVC